MSRDTPKEMIKKEFDSCLKAFYVNFKNFDDRETISMSPFKWMIVNLTLKKFIINQENKSEFTALLEKTKLLFDNHIAPLLEQK